MRTHVHVRSAAAMLVAGVVLVVAAPAEAKQQKVPGTFVYSYENRPDGCSWGIGIVFPKVPKAVSYVVKYYDGYYRRVIVTSVVAKEAVPPPDGGSGSFYVGVTGGNASPPCDTSGGDAAEGGRFTKGAVAYAQFAPGYEPPPPDGIDWKMPPRLNKQTWDAKEGLPERRQVHPDGWKVNLLLTSRKLPVASCPSNVRWKWTIKAPKGGKVVDKPADGCTTSMEVSTLGTYRATATKYVRKRGAFRKTSTHVDGNVVVKDWLLVGLGDSNGSGEGNPPFAFAQCNRTEASYQYQTAQYVESHDPRSSVTFVFAACSGAVIEELYKFGYAGINPSGAPLDPQIKQAARLIDQPLEPASAQRKVDGAIVSIGVNNLGFGGLIKYCVANVSVVDACEHQPVDAVPSATGGIDHFQASSDPNARTLQTVLDGLVADLPAKYAGLGAALSAPLGTKGGGSLGIKPGHVMITQYPDFTRGSDGQRCSGTIGPESTWDFVAREAAGLNAAVSAGASANGWKVVTLDQSVFTGPPTGHGYCASDSFFVPITGAATTGNLAGGFHPTGTGHTITAKATRIQLCTALYGNPACDGKPK